MRDALLELFQTIFRAAYLRIEEIEVLGTLVVSREIFVRVIALRNRRACPQVIQPATQPVPFFFRA